MPAQRAYGMDQDVYPWSPIITRPVLRWPDNARVALAVIVNLEHWDWEVPPQTPLAVSPLGCHPLPEHCVAALGISSVRIPCSTHRDFCLTCLGQAPLAP